MKQTVRRILRTSPLLVGLSLAALLYAGFNLNLLHPFSPMGYSHQFDHHTLTRCGLAVRNRTNLFTSSQDYKLGYHATNWTSLPGLCLSLGVPLSYLPPTFTYHLMNTVYFLIHALILILFGLRLSPNAEGKFFNRDYLAFAGLGFFFPWVVIYVLGQYHAVAVLGLALSIYGGGALFWGFLLSALAKPLMAPGIIPLALAGRWKLISRLTMVCALLYLPWVFVNYTPELGFHFGSNPHLQQFLNVGSSYSKYSVFRWNQELSWAKVFEEFFDRQTSLYLRQAMGMIPLALAGLLGWRKKLPEALCLIPLIYLITYARGHEYHLTLYTPILAYLYTRPDGAYRKPWMVAIILYAATPTIYPLFRGLIGASELLPDSTQVLQFSPTLYFLWNLQKPILSLVLTGVIAWRELVVERRTPVSESLPFAS